MDFAKSDVELWKFETRVFTEPNLYAQLFLSSENEWIEVFDRKSTNPHQIFENPRQIFKISSDIFHVPKYGLPTPPDGWERLGQSAYKKRTKILQKAYKKPGDGGYSP